MSLDWGQFVKIVAPKDKRVFFYAFCQDCGVEVKACWRCEKRCEFLDGACRICWNSFACPQPDDPLNPSVAPMFFCEQCEQKRNLMDMHPQWNWKEDEGHDDRKEIWKYDYKPASPSQPLSRENFVRTPRFVETQFQRPTRIGERKYHAKRAFEEEMKFSGNLAEALIVYSSFFQNRPSDSEGHLTGAQLLNLVQKHD